MIVKSYPYLEITLTELDLEIERLRHEIALALHPLPMDTKNVLAKIVNLDAGATPSDEAELAVLTMWHRAIVGGVS